MNTITFKLSLDSKRELSQAEITQLYNHIAKCLQKGFRNDPPTWCEAVIEPKLVLTHVRTQAEKETFKIKACLDAISDGTGIDLSRGQLEFLLSKYPLVDEDVNKWGANDTVVSGQLCDMVSNELIGKNWPTYGDNVDMAFFYEELHREATNRGYKTDK